MKTVWETRTERGGEEDRQIERFTRRETPRERTIRIGIRRANHA